MEDKDQTEKTDPKRQLSACIVLYKNNENVLLEAINSFLNAENAGTLYLVDNSPTDQLRNISSDQRIEYIFNNKNLGFGKAHNLAIKRSWEAGYLYHLVLNPDVYFEKNTLNKIEDFLDQNTDVALLMPKVFYPDGKLQHLCKLLPSPVDLIFRRFFPNSKANLARREIYELRFTEYKSTMNVPYLSGCFMFLRNSALKEVGLFDENIFMYIEDCDLTRRLHRKYKTLFWPEAEIYHHYSKGSYRNWRLMLYNIHGAFVYFCKYGWFAIQREKTRIKRF